MPYSGSIRAEILHIAPGFAKVRMQDRRRVRNHFRSVHAVALTNLGELASGLAITAAMPPHLRAIPIALSVEFLKKARGTITAEGHCRLPSTTESVEHQVEATLEDDEGDRVARFTARWLVAPKT